MNPVKRISGYYCGYHGIVIEGTKESRGRGHYYDVAVILPNGDILIGSEEGNYAGGIWLSPVTEDYQIRVNSYLERIKKSDEKFYKLIKEELDKMVISRRGDD